MSIISLNELVLALAGIPGDYFVLNSEQDFIIANENSFVSSEAEQIRRILRVATSVYFSLFFQKYYFIDKYRLRKPVT